MQNIFFQNTEYNSEDYKDHVASEGIYGELKTDSGASEAWQTITPEEIVEKSTTIRENICINQFHVGGAISRQLEIRLVGNSWSLGVGEIYMYYQYNLDDGGTGTVALGDFIIDMQSIKRTQSYTEFQGYDYFAKADKVIMQDDITAFENSSNKTLLSLVGYAANKCGLLFPSGSSFYNIISGHYNNTAKPNMSGGSAAPYSLQRAVNAQATWRDVLSSAAALVGCALKIGRTRVAQGQYNEKKGNVIYGVPFYTTIKDDSSFSYIIGQYRDQGTSPGVHTISINTSTFVSKIDRPCEYHFVFVYHNSNWYLFNGWEPDWDNVVSLAEYGITIQSGTPLESDLIDIMPPIMRTSLYTFDETNSIKREISETSSIVMSVSYSDASFLPGSVETLSQYLSLDLGDNILLPETQGASTMQMIIEATKKNSTSSTARGTGIRADTGTNGDAGALQLYNANITWFGDPCLEAGDFVTSKQNWQTFNKDVSFYVMENVFRPHANCTIRSFAGTTSSIYSATGYNYGGSTGGANSGSTELAVEIAQINQRLAGTSFVVTTSAEYEEMAQHGSKTFYILSDTDELYFGDDPIGSGSEIAEALRETNNQKEMRVWIGTTAEYAALEAAEEVVPNTLYIRTDETLHPEAFEQMVEEQVYTAMSLYEEGGGHIGGDLDQGFISTLREINHRHGFRVWLGTMAEYEEIAEPERDVLYIRTDEDSGWQDLTISGTGFTAGTPAPKYRRVGSKVFLRGQVVVDMDNISDVTTIFATLPEGYRPSVGTYQLIPGEGDRMSRLYIRPSGGVNINYFKSYAGDTVTGSHWIQLNCDFFTD